MKQKIKLFFKSRKKLKRIVKTTRGAIYTLFNLFYVFSKLTLLKQVRKLDIASPPFLLTRHDMGCWLHSLHYASLRNESGIVFLLSSYYREIQLLAKLLFPQLKLVTAGTWYTDFLRKYFGHYCLQVQTFNPLYSFIRSHRLDSLVLFDMPMELEWPVKGSYDLRLDLNLNQTSNLPNRFVEAYKQFRQYSQHRQEVFHDYIHLAQVNTKIPQLDSNLAEQLMHALNIEEPYAILNMNCKTYHDPILDRRSIHFPQRYNVLIDKLISEGYTVVLQGRDEQPFFQKRAKLIDYSKSDLKSLENDVALFSRCSLIVSSKTGPEVFGTIFDKPTLGLNYVEPSGITPTVRLRYFPKRILNSFTGQVLSWKECYFQPSFFHFGQICLDPENQYIDMTKEELYNSLLEFLPLVNRPKNEWLNYSSLQKEFKEALSPLHLGAHACAAVPLDTYLLT